MLTNNGVLPNVRKAVLQMRGRERGMEGQPVPLSLLRPMHSHNGARYRRISHQRQKGSHSTTSMAECHKGRAIRYHKDARNGCRIQYC